MYSMTLNWNLQRDEKVGEEGGGGGGGSVGVIKKIPIVGEVHAWCSATAYMHSKYDLYNSHLKVLGI